MSSAACERSFSCLRRLKAWLRWTMNQKRLNGVVLAHVHQALIDKIDLSKVADNCVQKNDSREAILGKPRSSLFCLCLSFFFFFSFRCYGHACAIFFSLVFFLLFASLNGSFRCVASYFSSNFCPSDAVISFYRPICFFKNISIN